jgi:hypothetical protein
MIANAATIITLSQSNQLAVLQRIVAARSFRAIEIRWLFFPDEQIMFLICSQGMLCSTHEPSILKCPQAPAGHGALRTGGCAFPFS